MDDNINVFIIGVPWVVVAIFLGIIACLILYKGKYRDYFLSSLFIKTIMWLPLYGVFCLASRSVIIAGVFATLMAVAALYEWSRKGSRRVIWYLVCFLTACVVVPVALGILGSRLWMTVVMTSVLSDVAAFFFGKAIGRHRLPDALNSRKSVEGVVGQIVGGVIGIMITGMIFGVTAPWWLGFVIGVMSTVGDLANSYTKRTLRIDDWGETIPGHGGVMDRFCSLNTAIVGATIAVLLFSNS